MQEMLITRQDVLVDPGVVGLDAQRQRLKALVEVRRVKKNQVDEYHLL